jgi:hypothetical protein
MFPPKEKRLVPGNQIVAEHRDRALTQALERIDFEFNVQTGFGGQSLAQSIVAAGLKKIFPRKEDYRRFVATRCL